MAGWSPEDDALLCRLWKHEGLSATLCARQMPGRTRNAVIGRVSRKGWGRPPASDPGLKSAYPKRASPKGARRGGPRHVPGAGPVASAILQPRGGEIEHPSAKPWIEREFGECAYPVGDATGADQLSCCNPSGEETYCPGHRAIMFNGIPKPINTFGFGKPKRVRWFKEWAA